MKRLLAAGVIAAVLVLGPAHDAEAFCGFYVAGADAKLFNDATQVVMMRKGTRTVLSMQNSYQGPPESFAMVVPVPVVLSKDNVKTLPASIFGRVDSLGAPRLVEYWEQDPCQSQIETDKGAVATRSPRRSKKGSGSGRGYGGVTVEAEFKVGEYDIVILSAKDSGGLEAWLKTEGYSIPAGAEPYLRPYVQAGSKFFVARVDVKKVKFEGTTAMLSPLRFHYDSEQFVLPVRLGMMNSQGTQDLIVNILSPGKRFEVANAPNVTIPTNIDLRDEAKGRFGEFYAALFDRTLEKNPGAVVTEYSWDAATCDPCPLPALRPGELQTLGADVLETLTGENAKVKKAPDAVGGRVARRRRPPRSRNRFVLTRLHLRYAKDTVGEDLVFREAKPIAGGREWRGADGKLEERSKPYSRNMFQARYAIRHPWTGKIECQSPVRNVWGGPPGGQPPAATPATRLASVKRGATLARLVAQDVPEIAVTAGAGGPATAPTADPAPDPADTKNPDPQPKPEKRDESKGCSASGGAHSGALAVLALLGLIAARRSRRRRRRR